MSKYRTVCIYSLVLLVIFSSNCNRGMNNVSVQRASTASEQPLVIRTTQSPTDGDSREPELTATQDGRVILSWVEKLGDKRYTLRTAMLGQNGWSDAQTVADGDNWFINWADFPSVIALKDGTLAAHWLVKSGSSTYAYDVNVCTSNDAGKTWIKPIV